jgi:hypothetical protein
MAALPYHYETGQRRKPPGPGGKARGKGRAGSHLKVLRGQPAAPAETVPTREELLEGLSRHPAAGQPARPTRQPAQPARPPARRSPATDLIYAPPPARLPSPMPPPRFDWVGLDELDDSPQMAPSRPAPAPPLRRAASTGKRGLRRYLPGIATLAVVAGVWLGAGSLVALRPAPAAGQAAAGASLVAGRSYVARPGDTLWGIASRLDPTADPRPIVAELAGQLDGKVLQPGDRLVLP